MNLNVQRDPRGVRVFTDTIDALLSPAGGYLLMMFAQHAVHGHELCLPALRVRRGETHLTLWQQTEASPGEAHSGPPESLLPPEVVVSTLLSQAFNGADRPLLRPGSDGLPRDVQLNGANGIALHVGAHHVKLELPDARIVQVALALTYAPGTILELHAPHGSLLRLEQQTAHSAALQIGSTQHGQWRDPVGFTGAQRHALSARLQQEIVQQLQRQRFRREKVVN